MMDEEVIHLMLGEINSSSKTILGYSKALGILLYGGFSILGLVLGYFLPRIADWALKLPWLPFEGPIKLIHTLNGPWLPTILAILGFIAGIVIAYIAIKEILIITLTDQEILLEKDEQKTRLLNEQIESVFLDGKELVILGKSGYELVREKHDDSPKKICEAFINHGYSWLAEGDPFKEEYRRWVPDSPELSLSANALMKAREMALKKNEVKDVKELRKELEKLGYIVRDEETCQYWRKVVKIG
ncbi:YqeB family protein [Heyndrickxia oleronia]|nr:DUF308 domain-containing protein [Heyndrickxia oleronia]